jgi:hypothetical protein
MGADRDDSGRFAPGNPGGPGRPRRATEGDYLAALSEAVPMERWGEIVATAIDQAVAGDAKAREWLGSYLAGKPTGNALRRLAAAEVEAAPDEEPATACDVLDVALDMERALTPAQSTALAALVQGQSVTAAARRAGVSPGTVRRWLADDPTFIAARNAALAECDDRPRAELAALGQKAVAILREAMNGHAESGEVRAAVEVVRLLKINEPAPARATDPADAERTIAQRERAQMLEDVLCFPRAGWRGQEHEENGE